ncbi:hypothetical protein [Polaromonas sp.]|uniref:hypothetical protein n=1 Tax=Polaromonas sp. TaxID=1869339 RepID=UPI001828759E|nr:hypothetical protein [Polaromonas sp.]NMM07109.1 hypothetical protein [Polaromonas sp.]
MLHCLLLFISLVFIAGCAGTGQQSKQPSPQQIKVVACMAAIQSTDWIALEVPSSKSGIANKMAAATMKMGGSITVDALVKVLSQPTRPALAVIGESDELTAATLQAALDKLAPAPGRSKKPICFVGEASYAAQLKPVAESVGLPLFVVPHP